MRKVLVGIATLLLLALAVVYLSFDVIVGSAIEDAATRALGVESRVGFARLRLLDGSLKLDAVRIANPEGFEHAHFLRVDDAKIEADLKTARSRVVEIPLILLSGVEVALERDGRGTNYGVILENLRGFESGSPEPDADEGRQFVVRRLRIEDIDAYVEWSQLASSGTGLALTIPEIELRDLGGEGEALTSSELSSLIVQTVLASIVRHGVGLPKAILGSLSGDLREVTKLSGLVLQGAGWTEKALVEKAREGFEAAGEGAKQALEGLFGGDD